jgi:hypothetical protein
VFHDGSESNLNAGHRALFGPHSPSGYLA